MSRPSGPPPSWGAPSGGQRAQQPVPQQGQSSGGGRPAGPPPGWSPQQVQQQANTQSVFQQQEANEGGRPQQLTQASNLQAPPSQPQSFGVNGYNYQYSQCNGKKKALLIGINYIGTSNQLNGCINDVNNMSNFLQNFGFSKDNMVILTDANTNLRAIPTRQNMLDAMRWLTKDVQANDSLFFHYSGHGGQVADKDGDEYDGNDECIYPLDFEQSGPIIDDELFDILVRNLPTGVRLTALFDSCHSGSALDLPYTYSTKGVVKEPNLMAEAGEGLLGAVTSYMNGDMSGVMTRATNLVSMFTSGGPNQSAIKKQRQTKTSPADVIMMSGCKDDQTSADAKENQAFTGAMSYSFLKVMSQNSNQSYLTLLQNMRSVLGSKYSQKPQLSASHPIDVNLQFFL